MSSREELLKAVQQRSGRRQMTDWGQRADGSEKGQGFLGVLKRPDGSVSTEISVGVKVDGQEMEIPILVPTLAPEEVDSLLAGQKPTPEIVQKAVAHAAMRKQQGLPVFATAGVDY